MATALFIISAICFIAAWGTHMLAKHGHLDYCPYLSVPWMCAIPWLSGYVLAVIPETYLFNLAWYWVFLINIPVVFILGYFIAAFLLRRLSLGRGAGFDILILMLIGIIALIIGVIIQ